MTSYKITPAEEGLAIDISGVGDKQEQLLSAFGECASGQCSCPTEQYRKVEAMEVVPTDDTISIFAWRPNPAPHSTRTRSSVVSTTPSRRPKADCPPRSAVMCGDDLSRVVRHRKRNGGVSDRARCEVRVRSPVRSRTHRS